MIFLATSQWFVRMDGDPVIPARTASRARCAKRACTPSTTRCDGSRLGPRPHLQHGVEPPRLVHLAPARVGRADPGGRLHGVRRAVLTPSSSRRRPRVFEQHGADAWLVRRPIEEFLPPGLTCPSCGGRHSSARPTSSTSGSTPGRATRRSFPSAPELTWPRTCTSRAAISTAAGSRARCWWRWPRAAGRRPRGAHARLPHRPRGPEDVEVAGQRHRAAGGHQGERRRNRPAVGGDDRVLREELRVSKEILTAWSSVPQAPQHLPDPGREPL